MAHHSAHEDRICTQQTERTRRSMSPKVCSHVSSWCWTGGYPHLTEQALCEPGNPTEDTMLLLGYHSVHLSVYCSQSAALPARILLIFCSISGSLRKKGSGEARNISKEGRKEIISVTTVGIVPLFLSLPFLKIMGLGHNRVVTMKTKSVILDASKKVKVD